MGTYTLPRYLLNKCEGENINFRETLILSHDLRRLKALLTYFAVSHKCCDQNKSKGEVSFSVEFRNWGKEPLHIYNLHQSQRRPVTE